jgi:hypothetical protein
MLLILLLTVFLVTNTVYARDPKADSIKLDSFYKELRRKQFDAELRWVNEQTQKPPWYENTNTATVISAIGSLTTAIFAIVALLMQRKWQLEKDKQTQLNELERQKEAQHYELERQKETQLYQLERERQAHLYEALHWFEGKSQKRSIGIAVIEANWNSTQSLHKTWTSILTNQAIYLLRSSNQDDSAHEIANLKRIMKLLETHKTECSELELKQLGEALDLKSEDNGREPGLDLSNTEQLKELQNWKGLFPI